MKLKIIRENKNVGMWYNSHIGEEFEITEFKLTKDDGNHLLKIENLEQLRNTFDKYGSNFSLHASRDPHGTYYGTIKGGGPYWQINVEDTDYLIRLRKEKLKKLKN
jgi:hypothetical protein